MIDLLFTDLLRNKRIYLAATKGAEFEDRINTRLHGLGYSRLVKSDLDSVAFAELKKQVLDKATDRDIINPFPEYGKQFLQQPYGSQEFPDFLVFDGSRIVCLEVKFSTSKQNKPVWNSGLPRPNGIYIFGSAGKQDLTFFRGCDVVSVEETKQLHDFFDRGLKAHQTQFNQDRMKNQPYGFAVYIRKAFEQKATFNEAACLDFFGNPKRRELEQAVIDYLHR